MNIWLTTDTHFGHDKLIDYGRPEDFVHKIMKGLKAVQDDDMLIHLGDVCIGQDAENNLSFTNFNKARKILVRGNHDNKSINWYLDHGWDMCVDRFDMNIFGKRIAFTHQPEAWDGYFDVNIHGHFHDTDGRRQPDFDDRVMSGYNKLLALEYTDYKPVNLKKFLGM